MSDNVIGPAEVQGSDNAGALIRFQTDSTLTADALATASFAPTETSKALVICKFVIVEDNSAVITPTITITENGDGTVVGGAAQQFTILVQDFDDVVEAHALITGATNAHVVTCALGGADGDNSDIASALLTVLWFPQ